MPPTSATAIKDVLLGSDAAATVELLLNLLTDAASQRDVSSAVGDVIQVRPRASTTRRIVRALCAHCWSFVTRASIDRSIDRAHEATTPTARS